MKLEPPPEKRHQYGVPGRSPPTTSAAASCTVNASAPPCWFCPICASLRLRNTATNTGLYPQPPLAATANVRDVLVWPMTEPLGGGRRHVDVGVGVGSAACAVPPAPATTRTNPAATTARRTHIAASAA